MADSVKYLYKYPKTFETPGKAAEREYAAQLEKVKETLITIENRLNAVLDVVSRLDKERYPRNVGMTEACKILNVGRTTMTARLAKGYYPFAFKDKESGQWQFPLIELYRFRDHL